MSAKGYGPLYEAGNIIAKYYPSNELPEDNELKSDLEEFVNIYSEIKPIYKEIVSIKKGTENLRKLKLINKSTEKVQKEQEQDFINICISVATISSLSLLKIFSSRSRSNHW